MSAALGYLIGRVRSKEGRLLTAADWQKYNSAEGLADWLPRLQGTDYAAAVNNAGTYEQFEKYLHQEWQNLRVDLFGGAVKPQGLVALPAADLFWQRYDNHNLKILLKERLTGQELDNYLLPLGKTSLALFEQRLIAKAAEIYAQSSDFCRLDYFLDQEYFARLKKQSADFGPEISAYVKAQIDTANYKLWYSGAQRDYAYFPGGSVSLGLLGGALETLPAASSPAETLRKCFPGIELPETLDDGAVEKALDDYTNKLLFKARYSCGIAAVLCYLQAKENEIKNLKTLYLRQSRQLPALQAYLRHVYV